jgi:RNA polymerase sigma-70 factor (ECF subfamily)
MEATGGLDAAIEAAVAAYASMVRAMAHQHRLAPSDLDEIFQEVRIRLWHAKERGERIEVVSPAYVYRIARTAAIDVIRRTHHSEEHTLGSTAERKLPWGGAPRGADTSLDDAELDGKVRGALGALPDARRTVVEMHLAGYAAREIAAMLGWTAGKVRNLLSRGLADLRARLGERGVGPEGLQ